MIEHGGETIPKSMLGALWIAFVAFSVPGRLLAAKTVPTLSKNGSTLEALFGPRVPVGPKRNPNGGIFGPKSEKRHPKMDANNDAETVMKIDAKSHQR